MQPRTNERWGVLGRRSGEERRSGVVDRRCCNRRTHTSLSPVVENGTELRVGERRGAVSRRNGERRASADRRNPPVSRLRGIWRIDEPGAQP